MPSLLRRAHPPDPDGRTNGVTPAEAGWRYVEFGAYSLEPEMAIHRPAADKEIAVVVLEGAASIRAGKASFDSLGSRRSVFDGPPPPVVLVEPGVALEVRGDGPEGARILLAAAPAGDVRRTAVIEPASILVEERGAGITSRTIHHLLPPAAEAGRLILFEVFTPGGNWSSYPPHKHDTEDPPAESYLEEVYYYRFARPQGYALQRVYTPDRSLDETVAPMDGDVVLGPRGYHPVGAPAGYDCYYLNAMAGPSRRWHFTVDPDHAWLMNWDPAAPTAR